MIYKYDFSIIIPVYNSEKYIKDSIDSIINQDYDFSKIQVILVNDGSIDNSYNICKDYSDRYDNIIVINQKNKGVSTARNNGIKKALGKYILFLDSDDYISNNTCKCIYTFFEKNYNKIDIVVYPLIYSKPNGLKKHFRYNRLYNSSNTIYDINKKPELIQTTINYCIKNKFKDNLYFDRNLKIGEDEKYATNIILEKGKIGYCSECVYYYRLHNTNTISKFSITLKDYKKYIEYYTKLLSDNPNNKYIINLTLNNLRWRLEEDKLLPYTNNKSLRSRMIKSLKELLNNISEEDIMKLSYLKVRTRMALLYFKDIVYKYNLKGENIIISTNKNDYKYKNKIIININDITNKYISGTIEKSFDLLEKSSLENFDVSYFPIYANSYIDNIYETNFKYKFKNKNYISIDELLYNYPSYTIKLNKESDFFYNYSIKNKKIIIKKKRKKILIKQLLINLKLYTPISYFYRKSKSLIKRTLQKLRRSSYILLYKYYCKKYELNSNKVLFLSASRDSLTGNFEFVYNELKKYKDIETNQVLKKSLNNRYSFKEKLNLMKLIASSKFILLDDFYPMIYALKLRKNQELIQLWHAMGAFKTVGYSRMGKVGGPSVKSLTHKNYTATIVSSENIRKNYSEAFGITIDKVHALGIPRTDIFFDDKYKNNIINKLKKKYPFIKNKKVILFAPTFRGNGQKSAYYNYKWLDFKKIKEELKDEYVFLLKLHPFIKDIPDIIDNQFYFDFSSEREINDLLFVTDILITDYSSVIFEYSFFKKPVIFFIPDYDEYVASRDFYYDFDKYMYGSTAKNVKELIKCVKDSKVDTKKIEKFYDYFCSSCDGNSTKRVVEELIIKKK